MRLQRYPPAIKRGTGKSPINGSLMNLKVIYTGRFSIALFGYRIKDTKQNKITINNKWLIDQMGGS